MARTRKTGVSPTLKLEITAEEYRTAIDSNSGGCLIADAIKRQYPHLSTPLVDMATIRVSDRVKGERYTYLTPPAAQHVLLSFDQGWPNPVENLTVRAAVKITQITRRRGSIAAKKAKREGTRAVLEAKKAEGEDLTRAEKIILTQIRKPYNPTPRPSSKGPTEVMQSSSNPGSAPVVVGGPELVLGPAHPNLLRGRNRIFGAKLADAGRAFNEAVEERVAERLAEQAPPADLS